MRTRLALMITLSLFIHASSARAAAPDSALTTKGQGVYTRFCLSCHGTQGNGRGLSAEGLNPRPRDFTAGIFKFRTTPSGSLPTDEDLLRTLRGGLHHTNMPGWEVLGERNLRAVAEYLKTFSPRWQLEEVPAPVEVPPETPDTPEARERGRELYHSLGCNNCHGETGHGDGPSAAELKDDWGEKIVPFDFTSGKLKCGAGPRDIYRTFLTGLNGTPMPSYAGSITPEDGWALAHFLHSLGTAGTPVVRTAVVEAHSQPASLGRGK